MTLVFIDPDKVSSSIIGNAQKFYYLVVYVFSRFNKVFKENNFYLLWRKNIQQSFYLFPKFTHPCILQKCRFSTLGGNLFSLSASLLQSPSSLEIFFAFIGGKNQLGMKGVNHFYWITQHHDYFRLGVIFVYL